jgi:hypothetical protein
MRDEVRGRGTILFGTLFAHGGCVGIFSETSVYGGLAMGGKDGPIDVRRLQGFKYFVLVDELLQRLHGQGTERDKAGNRRLFFDQYATLMLLYYFNPTVTTLRGVQQFTTLEKVQRLCGVEPTALGALSEAARVFDPAALEPIVAELAAQAGATASAQPSAKEAALAGLIAVDGSLLRALPRMAWAVWQDAAHRAAKLHVAFAVFPAAVVQAAITAGVGPERDELRRFVRPGGFYVADRGYADYSLFQELDALGCRFVIRVQQNAAYEPLRENPLSDADRAAGVVRDVTLKRLGTDKHNALLKQPLRIVEVRGSKPEDVWLLATNAHELSAELIAVAYRYRWQVELFFRWLKCVLGCRHLLSENQQGVTLQVYLAVITALLIGLWVGAKPNKRTYEMICHYLSGWATADELESHLQRLREKPGPPSKS